MNEWKLKHIKKKMKKLNTKKEKIEQKLWKLKFKKHCIKNEIDIENLRNQKNMEENKK